METITMAKNYFYETQHYLYITPHSFTDFINTYKELFDQKRSSLKELQERYETGLERLKNTQEQVEKFQEQLENNSPMLIEKQIELEKILENLKEQHSKVGKRKDILMKEEHELNIQREQAEKIKEECEFNLNKATPELFSAIGALQNLSKAEINELKTLKNPPNAVKLLMEGVCILLKVDPIKFKAKDGVGFTKDYWAAATSKHVLGNQKLQDILINFDHTQLDQESMQLLEELTENPEFLYENIARACRAARVFPGNGPNVIREGMQRKGNWKEVAKEEAFEKANFIWKPTNFNYKMYTKIDQIQKDSQSDRHDKFVVNHLENIKRICTKTGLIKTLKTYYKGNAEAIDSVYSVFDSTPTSFVVSSSLDTYEYHQFVARYMDLQRNEGHSAKERIPQKHCTENYWLVKPANMNQGRGIEIFNDLQEIQKFLSSRPMFSYWVIQKYIEKPLLFKNRKFDIRVWALATHDNEFYFYKDGYLRTSSDAYSLDNENNYVHLTNNCLQKNGDNYGKFEDGNTIGFEAFQEYLDKEFPQYKLNVNEHFLKRIRDLMLDVYHLIISFIIHQKKDNSLNIQFFQKVNEPSQEKELF